MDLIAGLGCILFTPFIPWLGSIVARLTCESKTNITFRYIISRFILFLMD